MITISKAHKTRLKLLRNKPVKPVTHDGETRAIQAYDKADYYLTEEFNSNRKKLKDTPHRIAGKHVHSTRSDKMHRAMNNGTEALNGQLWRQKTYYPDMQGMKVGCIF